MHRRIVVLSIVVLLVAGLPAGATFPFPPGGNPYDYTRLKIQNGSCDGTPAGQPFPAGADLPSGFDCRDDWKLSDYAAVLGDEDYDPIVAANPQEFFGVRGPGTNRAWETTTGRPDTLIAVLDSGIRWSDTESRTLVNKFYLNRGELPRPGTGTKGGTLQDYDVNGDGVFNIRDYAGIVSDHTDDENDWLDPADLIRVYSDGVDDDGNGYVDDISGWDFFEGDNDAGDDVKFGHGTGESKDSAAEVGVDGSVTQCPNCMLMELRVGDSFVADINHWAEATIYATDNGASVVQEALGTLNHSAFGQAAADYAWANGVLVVASEADESAGHHNYPAALNHTMVVNSVVDLRDVEGVPIVPKTWLAFNGCTNFGGYTWLSVSSASCSSDATGQSSGYAGLLYSAARNAIETGVIAQRPDTKGRALSAAEAKQLFRVAAEDIDFSTPKPPGPPNNFATPIPASQRFVTTEGWDQISGWGRARSDRLVAMVRDGKIPPEADIVSPRWWQPLPDHGSIQVAGRVAAPRASAYTYEVQFAPGVQPPRWPAADAWTTVGTGSGTSPIQGVLATIDLAAVRTAILTSVPPYTPADDPTARDLPEKDAFRVRVVVRDDRPETGDAIEQRQFFATDRNGLMEGFPRFLGADGASSPALDDLNGDGKDEIVIADSNGLVHAFTHGGGELPGFPVHTAPLALPAGGTNAYSRGSIRTPVYAPVLLGSPTVADLDRDGTAEIAAADIEGNVWVWNGNGSVRAGFPVRGNPNFSEEPGCNTLPGNPACDDFAPGRNARDKINTVDRAFTAQPAAGDLDPSTPGLELVIGSNDGHVYAWRNNGTAVPGWPVLLRDQAKVAAVDPVTHRVTHTSDSGVLFGRKILAGVTLGDVDGDGDLEVAANVNEEYDETPNWSVRDPIAFALAQQRSVTEAGNTRAYLLHHDGTAHTPSPAAAASAHPDDQAYVSGWPAKIGMLVTELLPYVGEGSNGAPVMGDVDGDGRLEIATASIAGPAYLLKADGSSFYGNGPDGAFLTMGSNANDSRSPATDFPSFPSIGGGVFGRLGGSKSPLSFAIGGTGLRRLLDVVLPEQQLQTEDHLHVYDAVHGGFAAGFPAQVNDLMFFNTPSVADLDGDDLSDVVTSTAMYDVRAFRAGGVPAVGFPKFTGGWSVMTPGVGDVDGDGKRELVLATREGNLFVWRTGASACGSAEWPKYQHDLWNTGAYTTDATRPGLAVNVNVHVDADSLIVSAVVNGDGRCGPTVVLEIEIDGRIVRPDARSGNGYTFHGHGDASVVRVRGVDAAGNRGPWARVMLP